MADAFAKRDEVLSEESFLVLTGLSSQNFRRLTRDGRIPGVIQLAEGSYVVDMQVFLEEVER